MKTSAVDEREPRTVAVNVRLTPQEHEALRVAAYAARRTLADWARVTLLDATTKR